jgi:RHS repeat-associated protein
VDAAGSPVGEVRYRAFGATRFASGSPGTEYRYTGQREVDAIGLYYYRARWYEPYLHRWIQPDSIVPSADPLGLDRYSYVFNNPVKYTDPSGHSVDCTWTDTYCNDLRREYARSNSRSNSRRDMGARYDNFDQFLRARELYDFYTANPRIALIDSIVPNETSEYAEARVYSETVLGEWFTPYDDWVVMDQLQQARESDDLTAWYVLAGALALSDWVSNEFGVVPGTSIVGMDDAISIAGGFLGQDYERFMPTGRGTNYQFVRTTVGPSGDEVTLIARFDVNLADPHTYSMGPHLVLETQVNGRTTGRVHIDIDHGTVRVGDYP